MNMSIATCIKDYDGIGYLKDDTNKKKFTSKLAIKSNGIIRDIFGLKMFVLDIWMPILDNILNFNETDISRGKISWMKKLSEK